jgi:folate-binding protein YgfZ
LTAETSAAFRPEQGALFDLSGRAKLRISGADRLRYLNGQISNDLRKATETQAIHACVLTAKGKINADIFITADGDSFLVDTEAEMREALAGRLERYVIADDVQIEDVTDDFALFHVTREASPTPPDRARSARAERFGCPGTDIWLPAGRHDEAFAELSARILVCDETCAETFRIERGVPRWERELTDEIIPTEANLEAAAIDYAKGCYIGQEVISRIKMSGQTNKRLCGLMVSSDAPLQSGMRLASPDDAKDVGWITSATMSARVGRQIALGFVKRGYQEIGTRLHVLQADGSQAESVAVEVVPLPFV